MSQTCLRAAALRSLLLQVTHDVSHLTCADFLRAPGVQTPVIVRFSTGAVLRCMCVPHVRAAD
jgi:catalase